MVSLSLQTSWCNSHIQFKYCQLTTDRITVLRIYHVEIRNKILYYPLLTTSSNTTKSLDLCSTKRSYWEEQEKKWKSKGIPKRQHPCFWFSTINQSRKPDKHQQHNPCNEVKKKSKKKKMPEASRSWLTFPSSY